MVMDNRTLIEIDAKDLATPKIEKLSGKLKETSKSSGLLSTAFGDLTSKAEGAGIPIQGIQKYIGALGAGGIAAGAAAGIGAVAVGMGVLSFNTIQSTADLKDFADQTGLSVEQLTSMDLALKTSNVSTQQYSDAMTKLTVNMGKSSKEFKQLGISTTDPQKAFEQLRKKISETTDPIERARLGNMAFGKTFKDMMPLLRMTEQEFQNLKASSNIITTDQAEKAAELADKFDIMKAKIGGTATNIGLSMMPAMESLFNLFEKMLPVITGTLSVLGKLSSGFIDFTSAIGNGLVVSITTIIETLDNLWKKAKDILNLSSDAKTQITQLITHRSGDINPTRGRPGETSEEIIARMSKGGPANWQTLSAPPPPPPPPPETPEERAERLKKLEEARKKSLQAIIDSEQAKIRKAEFDTMVSSRFSNLPGYEQGIKTSTFGTKERTLTAKQEFEEAMAEPIPQTVYDMTPEETAQWIADNSEARKEAIKKAQEEEREAEDAHLQRMKDLRISYANQIANTMTGPFETLFKEMSRGEIKFQNFFESILDNFGNMLIQMAAQMASKAAIFGLLNLFTGGGASGLIGGFSSFVGFAANGSDYLPAGWTMVGERGPEMIYNDKPGAKVVSNAELKQSGKQMTIVNNFNVREVKPKQIIDEIDTYNRRYERYGIATVGA